MTQTPFHAGEREAQERAGVAAMAARIGRGIHPEIPPAARAFLEQADLIVLATTDPDDRPWASIVTGQPGMVQVPDDVTAVVTLAPIAGDPLMANLTFGSHIGLIAPDLATRRRMRLNGSVEHFDGVDLTIHAEQVFANCPKYIQRRVTAPLERALGAGAVTTTSLSEQQREWLRRADTFFVATANPGEGADVSHRGGMPGFIRVKDNQIRWPDYSGNMMFTTIGNLLRHPWAGLAIPDFAAGNVLLVSGAVSVDWSPGPEESQAGAERVMQLEVERVVELRGGLGVWSGAADPSPFNPPVR